MDNTIIDIVADRYLSLKEECKKRYLPEEVASIDKVYEFAYDAHLGVVRKSGLPYITHPIEVAKIVIAEMRLDAISVQAALLHDVIEDTEYSYDDLQKLFDTNVASIVQGLTKLQSALSFNDQVENIRKMILTIDDDLRVLFIKFADRLHNMRTLSAMPRKKQIQISGEKMDIFVPLALRFGFFAIKTELEDLCFRYTKSHIYKKLSKEIDEYAGEHEKQLAIFLKPIAERLEEAGIEFKVKYRKKSVYSTWEKLQKKDLHSVSDIYDIVATRVIFKDDPEKGTERDQCWDIYKIITHNFPSKPDRTRDWLSSPKSTGYEALHVTVMGPFGRWVEVQIRSERMNETAEFGIASHLLYKGETTLDSEFEQWLHEFRISLKDNEDSGDTIAFLDRFKLNLFVREVSVYTPKGDPIRIAQGATVLDYAYKIHSQIGFRCIGAKVGHRTVGLDYKVQNGEQIKVLTSSSQIPEKEWLNIVKTPYARREITVYFKKRYKNLIARGRTRLNEVFRTMNLSPTGDMLSNVQHGMNLISLDLMYAYFGRHGVKPSDIKDFIKTKKRSSTRWFLGLRKRTKLTNAIDTELLKRQMDGRKVTEYEIADCCQPKIGDIPVGYFEENLQKMIVHQNNCVTLHPLRIKEPDKIIPLDWKQERTDFQKTTIHIAGEDRHGLVSQLTGAIAKLNMPIRGMHIDVYGNRFEGDVQVYIKEKKDLDRLLNKIRNISGVEMTQDDFIV